MSSSLEPGHPLLAKAEAQGVPHDACADGQSWTWDGVRFEVLHPVPADYATATRPNALSCVVRVAGAGRSLLLTGDLEAAQEAALLARTPELRSDVLQVPHHGSRTSSSPAFVDAVEPRVAVVQAAYRSRFGHPAADVVARYAARGSTVVRSDTCGAWTLPAAGPAVCEREQARRYWHHAP
jgi:competence protein ComEC